MRVWGGGGGRTRGFVFLVSGQFLPKTRLGISKLNSAGLSVSDGPIGVQIGRFWSHLVPPRAKPLPRGPPILDPPFRTPDRRLKTYQTIMSVSQRLLQTTGKGIEQFHIKLTAAGKFPDPFQWPHLNMSADMAGQLRHGSFPRLCGRLQLSHRLGPIPRVPQ